MSIIIAQIRQELKELADEKTKQSGLRFFKESVKLYGVKTAAVGKLAKEHFQRIRERNKTEIFKLCEELWQSGYLEESFIACSWSYAVRQDFQPADLQIFSQWINKYVNNWASCDTFCNHTVGAFIEMYPEYLAELKKWARSSNRWLRRAAAVSLIIPAKQGKFSKDIFAIADIVLLDPDDMVQKGYGWLLKELSRQQQRQVLAYVLKNKQVMPRTALRYAIEKMQPQLRTKAMAK